jgi:hypothetical protein
MNKFLVAATGAAVLLGAVGASAQGLPYSSGGNSDRPWSINQQPPRDANAYLGDSTESQTEAPQHNSVAKK